ncbi:murein transglycosylase A [Limnobacter parvus]|uniref:peptidoglycan lytic exotransglycosylase n=1 Tax=Limnobacter parvus TaxID=2939690 RepID=A0ABT1XCN5_9BURK|nr:MltA domain-containing protein [Limnobacter parvus]MCR2745043.1 MltA domain-containing protein [Limnobacter parvus]
MFNPLRCFWPSTVLAGLILSGCASTPTAKPVDCSCPAVEKPATVDKKDEKPVLPLFVKSDFSKLPGWGTTDHKVFLEAFAEQCSANGNALAKRKATPSGLLDACRKARQNMTGNALLPAQIWMEANFDVWQLQQEDGKKEGLLTGYFEPMLKGSRTAQGPYSNPLYGVPDDLITVKLDTIYPELKGKRLRGRLQGDTLVPFFDRAEWERLGPDREKPIVWVNDKLDAFLLQVQGSGRVTLQDGTVIRLSYAEQNGHPYKSIGKVLVDRGELTAAQTTIPGIRNWAKANPGKLDDLLNANPSVVFFKENKVLRPQEGPVGAMGVPLTGGISLAIDREKIPYGSPMWIESSNPVNNSAIAHGVLAQDTGGAIRGRVRADYFWGTGEAAGEAAGLTRQPLKMWLIWPKGAPLPESGS